ncbi:DNA repair protein rad50 [Tieghemiomyces parasiticus]|uniref:DNA repair protein RAD50 n=1 Tax=Tieghemiomyces parasiticus TaxID=78921 RepID=A0A9W8AJZ9_9FUNG|nr:DNA repair protein rad50 [Tieghemiomyces parasiticus]
MVRGIRSFSPDDASVIDFFTPLTIIMGHNGSGKTTVIECLKYATTGDLPPNSKGGAFIHDPKLNRTPDTKAQIRLKFRNVNRQTLVCTRSIQLTRKGGPNGGTVSQKTLENLLVKVDSDDPTKQVSLSTRCADLDLEMPIQLGVSKAVLQNVIFCHQEESNWPLSDAATVKKKFDEIFAATRYTKALDNIRSIRKEQTSEIKLDQQRLSHLQENRGKAERLRTNLMQTVERLRDYRGRLDEQVHEAAQLEERIGELKRRQERVVHLQAKRDRLGGEIQVVSGSLAHLERITAVMTEPLEEIKRMLESQEDVSREIDRETKVLDRQVAIDDKSIQDSRREATQLAATQGRLELRVQDNDREVRRLADLLLEMRDTYGLTLSFRTSDAATSSQLLDDAAQLQKVREAQSLELAKMKGTHRRAEQELRAALRAHEANIHQLDQRRAELERQKETQARLRSQDDRIDAANEALRALGSMADLRARLALKQQEREAAQAETISLTAELTRGCADLNGIGRQPDPTPAGLQAVVNGCTTRLAEAEARARHLAVDVAKGEGQLQGLLRQREMLADKVATLTRTLKALTPTCTSTADIANLVTAVGSLRERLSKLQGMTSAYDYLKKEAARHASCPLCDREFRDYHEDNTFNERIESKVAGLPAQIRQLESELRDGLAALDFRRRQLPLQEKLERTRTELKTAEQALADLRATLDMSRDAQQKASEDREGLATERARLVELQQVALKLHTAQETAHQLDATCTELRGQLVATGSSQTYEECQAELRRLSTEKKTIEADLRDLQERQRGQQEQDQKLHIQILEYERSLQTLDQSAARKAQLEAEVRLAEREIQDLEIQNEQLNTDQAKCRPDIVAAETALNEHVALSAATEERADEALRALSEHLLTVSHARDTLDRFRRDDVVTQLATCQMDLQTLEKRITTCEGNVATANDRLAELDRRSLDMDGFVKQLRDNVELHGYRVRLTSLRDLVAAAEADLTDATQTEAGDLTADLTAHEQRLARLGQDGASLRGEMKQLEAQRAQYQQELARDFEDIDGQFKDQLIKFKTAELAHGDLERYGKALDNAIMKYHSVKMEEINRTIRELWIQTYQGNDIDTIEIRSDCESTRGNRSYNYRVVMLKGDTALDMRGRCSAGQRVLSCLIIRMALAESFCVHCGILALDEPTTNLDRDNIANLADSLSHIIRTRRQQRNFQLIVITHDEAFVELLGRSDYTDHYWQVYKDETQHSRIVRRDIATS